MSSPRERLRFQDFALRKFPDGFLAARATLEWEGGVLFTGEARAPQTLEGGLRAGAEATLAAVTDATSGTLRLEYAGGKAVRAFDTWVVIVSLRGKSDDRAYRLMGAYACPDEDTARGSAMAVLDATNRLLPRYVGGE